VFLVLLNKEADRSISHSHLQLCSSCLH